MKFQEPKRTIPWFLIIVFLLLVIGILVTGYFFYRSQQQHFKANAQNHISAIADLKVEQITKWRQERILDGKLTYNNAALIRQVSEYLKRPEKSSSRQDILKLMKSFHEDAGYKTVLLLDKKGNVLLSIAQDKNFKYSYEQGIFQDVLHNRQIIFSDIHRSEDAPFVHIDLMIPLISPDRNDSSIIGIFLLCIDPGQSLYPLLKKWPSPSRSSETLLIERDGNEIVHLNELKYQKNATFGFRIPISNEMIPSSMAARGIEGVVEGKDYRNISVLAAIRKIQNTPWFIIAKVDQEEVFAPFRLQAWIIGLAFFLLILSCGAIIALWWRHQRARFYREQYEARVERQAIVKHFEYLIKYANDIILLADMDGRIVEANDQACKAYGYSQEEIHKLRIQDIQALSRTPRSINK